MIKSKASLWITFLLLAILFITSVNPAIGAQQESVRVWVAYQSGHKADLAQALNRAKASFHYDFPELEAYVVTLPVAALKGIQHNPFVMAVEEDAARYPIEPIKANPDETFSDTVDVNGQTIPWGIDAVQARDVWDEDRDANIDPGSPTGAGINVCIIDSGYYQAHEDLKNAYGGISQVDNDWGRDGYGHGTHVGGTISAENNLLGVVGVSPGAVNLFIVKIFADDGSWVVHASDLTAAIYTCRDNGANVISMSLGGPRASNKERSAFASLYAAGILHVASAGNEQVETPFALSYPASYDSVISVAAVDSAMQIADFSLQNDAVELAAPGVGVLSTLSYIEVASVTVDGASYGANQIEFSTYGTASGDLVAGGRCLGADSSWAGKVVLCERGDISFYDKVMNVQTSGGTAAVIYNNEPGNFLGTLGEGNTSTIIGVSLSQVDGQFLVANKLSMPTNVTSTLTKPASGYEAWDGTSMAAPHVSGVAALIWSAFPDLTNQEIRTVLATTALDLGDLGRDIKFGYGLVQAKDALDYLSPKLQIFLPLMIG
jgi:serine protease